MDLSLTQGFRSLKVGDISHLTLPDFAVLTGLNGAGKSNLLQAIREGHVSVAMTPEVSGRSAVRLFTLGQLDAIADQINPANFKPVWSQIVEAREAHANRRHPVVASQQDTESELTSSVMAQAHVTLASIERMVQLAGHPLSQLSIEDIQRYAPTATSAQDAFALSLGGLFVGYSRRRHENAVARVRDQEEPDEPPLALTEDEFFALYGQPPWDVLSEILGRIGLPYAFQKPPRVDLANSGTYRPQLTGPGDAPILVEDLSSGERVLLALGISLFVDSNLKQTVQLPRLLLLDEADASLHPSMVKNLIAVVQDVIVGSLGVPTILTTHSPTTVALAPESSLFLMSADQPRLKSVSTDEAVAQLTAGISFLSVNINNRRQIFVESEYDQAAYQSLFAAMPRDPSSRTSLEFIAVGRRDRGGGTDAVKRLVAELRAAGCTTIFGVIDKDADKPRPAGVFCIADRYALENLAYDPLMLGAVLLRERILTAADLGLPEPAPFHQLNASHAQSIADAVAARLGLPGNTRGVDYTGSFTIAVPIACLDDDPHSYETTVLDTFPQLRKFGSRVMPAILDRIATELPAYLPKAVHDLFDEIDVAART